MLTYSHYDIALKLFMSAVLGGIVGFERETHGSSAGLRTHILVSMGSCLIMLTSAFTSDFYVGPGTADPARIAAGVVTGIGFLGAGTILRYRGSVIGLTTAASIWVVSALGLAVGTGFYEGSLIATLLVVLTLALVHKFEHSMLRKNWYRTLVIEAKIDANRLQTIKDVLSSYMATVKDFEIEKLMDRDESRLRFDIKLTTSKHSDNIIIDMLKMDGVNKAHWE